MPSPRTANVADMTLLETLTLDQVAEVVSIPPENWANNCHVVSLEIVRSGLLPESSKVARGWSVGIQSQHSWVAVTGECYDMSAPILDATFHSNRGEPAALWIGTLEDKMHRPHGMGSIWEYGRPAIPTGPILTLNADLSPEATAFLNMVGPLDRRGWITLAASPVGGWPSKEILTALSNDPEFMEVAPIAVVGMLTDLNPGNLYR